VLEKVYPLGLAFSTTFAIWNPRPRLFRARHREWQLYVETRRSILPDEMSALGRYCSFAKPAASDRCLRIPSVAGTGQERQLRVEPARSKRFS